MHAQCICIVIDGCGREGRDQNNCPCIEWSTLSIVSLYTMSIKTAAMILFEDCRTCLTISQDLLDFVFFIPSTFSLTELFEVSYLLDDWQQSP